ncbi:MAG: insulinase family protein, partial [Planctomycetaceae bacterium]|nr:insulinase family protein [Planctomycetaceae bacterium]
DNMPKVEAAIREELDLLLKDGITAEELAAAKQGYLEKEKIDRADDAQLASTLRSTLYTGRTMQYYANLEKKINALTVDDVNKVLRKYVDPEKIALAIAGDFKEAK